jgi:pimeloyl-ACP methyl ester carboxylesterase
MSTTGALGVGQASPAVAKQMVKPIPEGVSALQNSVNTRQMFASPAYPQTDEEIAAEVQKEFERSNYPAGYLRQMAAAWISPNRKKLLQTIKVPTLIIHGNQDTLVNVSGGIETAKHIPDAKLVRFEGMGHTLPAALLETFVDLIDETARQS